MPALNKKPLTQTNSMAVADLLEGMSKAALADLVIDLVRRGVGDEVDGRLLFEAIAEAAEPILRVREDKPAPADMEAWARWRRRLARRAGPGWQAKVEAAIARELA